jgi:amino acid adenylation domain-containing protein/thioester reductase-like protein
VLSTFNSTRAEYVSDKLVHELFEEQTLRTPATIAVTHRGHSLTYAALNGRANQLARQLRALGVCPGRLVAVCVERGLDMVVGLLGILKAGGAYVPLDPNYPAERLQAMLDDARPQVVLTQDRLLRALPATSAKVVVLDAALKEVDAQSTSDLSRAQTGSSPRDLLYVIFTSGSTGRPKGTAMPHAAMINLIEWQRGVLQTPASLRVLQFAALSFDVAFQETFSTLCCGGTLVLLDEWIRRDARALLELLHDEAVERLFVPPLMLQSLAEYSRSAAPLPASLKDVVTAGEQLRISSEIVELFRRLPGCRLHNHYGPTETHVVTALTLPDDPQHWPVLPSIGRPIANTQIYILDNELAPVPAGVAGEIYIGGANLACGYLNKPELTTQRFVADPFGADARARLYRTGDLGAWRPDGTIDYIGRNDEQVKIRGFRVELGEIEARLALHPHVREVAVVARGDVPGGKRLVAYVTVRDGIRPGADELRAHLKEALPEHMAPSAFVVLPAMPMTPSGKLNRRALPAPEQGAYVAEQYQPPDGPVEQALAEMWREVLQVDRVGRLDSFFDLGGHSLLALKALLRLNQSFGCTLRVLDLYNNPTVRELAARIAGSARNEEQVDLAREAVLDDAIAPLPDQVRVPSQAVLLTGATGFVGRFLLAQLLRSTDAVIHCIVRAQSVRQATQRVRTALMSWDLWRDEFEERIVAIPGDMRQPRLGVDQNTYRVLAESVDCVYHCATSMNHLESYAMAKPANVEAARELLQLATQHRPKVINYISTLGIFGGSTEHSERIVREDTPIDHERHSASSGYVASKWVAERIFLTASERGIPCNIFRLGFVWADSQHGRYDELQRDYRIIKSCLLSGYGIENYRHVMPPTPVDYAARAVVHLGQRHAEGRGVFHISSPGRPRAGLFERCNELLGTSLELRPMYNWICEIKRLHHTGRSLPVVPLIEFAFSMNEQTFLAHESRLAIARLRIDCDRTVRELEASGIVAPEFGDDVLRACVESMLSRDPELRGLNAVNSQHGHRGFVLRPADAHWNSTM